MKNETVAPIILFIKIRNNSHTPYIVRFSDRHSVIENMPA